MKTQLLQGPDISVHNYHNAGGYGFWCNKDCAARKDAKREVKKETKLTAAETSSKNADALIKLAEQTNTPEGSNTILYIGIGTALLATGVIMYFALR
jgi:hypothetical protein